MKQECLDESNMADNECCFVGKITRGFCVTVLCRTDMKLIKGVFLSASFLFCSLFILDRICAVIC